MHFNSSIDATGKWIWEAQEIAAYYLIHEAKKYLNPKKTNFKVLELGAGCSGLASIALAKIHEISMGERHCQLIITDGQG